MIVPSLERICSRPLCGKDAEALLLFDYEDRHVVLRWTSEKRDSNLLELCVEHADKFRPPHGWSCEDQRQQVTNLKFVASEAFVPR